MKIPRVALLLLIASSFAQAGDLEKIVTLTGISKVEQMIGYLDEPYGTIVNVTGRVELVPPVKDGNLKGRQDRYFLVTHIKGRKLAQAITFDLRPESLPKAKHGDVVKARAYERLMMLGTPKELPGPVRQGRAKDLEFRLWRYLHVLPE